MVSSKYMVDKLLEWHPEWNPETIRGFALVAGQLEQVYRREQQVVLNQLTQNN